MEAALARSWLSAEVFARLGLGEMSVTEVTCRQTTCRIWYEYPARLEALVAASGLQPSSPMVLVEEALGWAAPRGGGLRTTAFDRGGEPMKRVTLVVGFDEASWDPSGYEAWVSGQRDAAQEFFRRARAELARRAAEEARARLPGIVTGDAG
jgi:hypothetical protein